MTHRLSIGVWALAACTLLAAQAVLALPAAAQTAAPLIGNWQRGPDGMGDDTYSGTIDQPSSGASQPVSIPIQLSGWVVDTTAQGWSGIDDVQVLDAPMNLGGRQIVHPTFQNNRPDVAAALNNSAWAAAGFLATVPANLLIPGQRSIYVYAHTPSKGWWYTQTTINLASSSFAFDPRLDLAQPTPLASLHAGAPFTVRGTAIDRNASGAQGTGIDRVQVYFNGDRQTGVFVGDATLGKADASVASFGSQFTSGGWELTFQPASAINTLSDNQICPVTVYARSSVTGQETNVTTSVLIELP